jgi:hypothetical protein
MESDQVILSIITVIISMVAVPFKFVEVNSISGTRYNLDTGEVNFP